MKKNIFIQNYTGPAGAHLSCLTHTTMFGSYEDDKQESIHWNRGRPNTRGKKRYSDGPICAPRNPNRKGYLAKASKELDRRRRDQEVTKTLISRSSGMTWTDGMYKVPGSMNIR